MNPSQAKLVLRKPRSTDGHRLHTLVKRCPPLDTNSVYCNLLQCTHFSGTSVVAELNGELVGFISGYLKPDTPNTLFIWQVAVGEQARGMGLATRMIQHLLARPSSQATQWLETTITEDNKASWALFEGIANKQCTAITQHVMFDQEEHFCGQHQTEYLVRIGPFQQALQQQASSTTTNSTEEIAQ